MPKISALTAATSVGPTDTLAIVQGGETKRASAAMVGIYARTAAEIAAGVTPTDYRYAPGDVRRYGAALDGVTNDTSAFSSAVACGGTTVIEGGILLTDSVTVSSSQSIVCRDATIKARSETGIGSGTALINVTASDCDIDVVIDHNSLGISGIKLTGNKNRIRVVGKNLTGSASSAGYESLVVDEGEDNQIDATAFAFAHGSAPNDSVPRIVTCQTSCDRPTIRVKGQNVTCGITFGTCTDALIESIDLDTFSDNGIYALAGCVRAKCSGGQMYLGAEPIVDLGTDNEWANVQAVNCTSLFGVENVTRSRWKNCSVSHTTTAYEGGFIRSRSGNTTSNGVYIENCSTRINIESGLFAFEAGTVNDLQVTGGQYVVTYQDGTTLASTQIVHHTAGDRVIWKDVFLRIKDSKSTPLASTDFLYFEVPTLTAASLFEGVEVVNESAGTFRTTGLPQANCVTRWTGWSRVDVGPYLQSHEDGSPPFIGYASSAPTTGTWATNSILFNTAGVAGEELGWYCTSGGTPGTWVAFGQLGYRSGAASPSGVVTPKFIGEEWLDSTAGVWYKSKGTANTDWVALN